MILVNYHKNCIIINFNVPFHYFVFNFYSSLNRFHLIIMRLLFFLSIISHQDRYLINFKDFN
jgi:hypothetical protein